MHSGAFLLDFLKMVRILKKKKIKKQTFTQNFKQKTKISGSIYFSLINLRTCQSQTNLTFRFNKYVKVLLIFFLLDAIINFIADASFGQVTPSKA